ncbi:MAG: hypothetical protein GY757_51355 [bacterium]|nr:hypothetical protein [bacterium]
MKRIVIISMLMVLIFPAARGVVYAGNGFISVSANFLAPADENFKEIYKSALFYPEVKAGVNIFKGLYVWGGYGFFSVDGTTLQLSMPASSEHKYLSGGVGYMVALNGSISFKAEAGVFNAKYKEEAMDLELSESVMGLRVNGGLMFRIARIFFIEASLSYMNAKDAIEGIDIKLGGFKSGIGVGIAF